MTRVCGSCVVIAIAGIGTGGYTIENFEPGVRTALKRFPNYWKTNRAHFDGARRGPEIPPRFGACPDY